VSGLADLAASLLFAVACFGVAVLAAIGIASVF
jgi:hypothetical protein